MRFEGAKIANDATGWHYVDAQGRFAQTHYPQRIGPDELPFDVRVIDGKTIAVFEPRTLPQEKRRQIETARPGWLQGILYAECVEPHMPPVGDLLVEIGYLGDVGPELCAFVVATVFEGNFNFDVAVFFVHLWEWGTYEVTLEFDYGSESWSGDVIAQDLLDRDEG